MSDLFAAVCSITPTHRRRFMWAAWWTAPPVRQPFRKPDAHHGGARTLHEAWQEAQQAAGVHLVEIEPRWARAWARILIGQPPWGRGAADPETTARAKRGEAAAASASDADAHARPSIWAVLGIAAGASAAEVKRAFHQRALQTHPDQGGDADTFRDVQRAYKDALKRVSRPRKTGTKRG